MILSFTDLHLGLKDNSKLEDNGLYTSEVEGYKSLDYIFNFCNNPENNVELIIFKGDWFHHTTPASIHYTKTINFFTRINNLNIPFYLIPGNHESTIFSNCLSMIHELKLSNIHLYDSLESINHVVYKDYNIYFVPYVYSESMKDRDVNVEQSFVDVINNIETDNNIIVSHIQEISAKIGAESLMIAKGVELIDVENISSKVKLILLGHMHKQQLYTKKNIPVVYAGSTYYQNKSDVNQEKGFITVDDNLNVTLHSIPTLRRYHKVIVNQETQNNIENILYSRKFKQYDVVYFDVVDLSKDLVLEETIRKACSSRNIIIGDLVYIKSNEVELNYSLGIIEEETPYETFKKWVDNATTEEHEASFITEVITSGNNYLDLFYKVN